MAAYCLVVAQNSKSVWQYTKVHAGNRGRNRAKEIDINWQEHRLGHHFRSTACLRLNYSQGNGGAGCFGVKGQVSARTMFGVSSHKKKFRY